MFIITFGVILLASSALSRNVPNFEDLDEEDHVLFRAAYEEPSYHEGSYNYYETPSYNQEYDNQIPLSKLDFLKDGMWALKAKMLQLKAFNKALAANFLTTKLKLKELIELQKKLPKHQHVEENPMHNYQPSSPPSYAQYEKPRPQYTAPAAPQYTASVPQYAPPAPQYAVPTSQYSPPATQYIAPALPEYTGPEQYTPLAPAAPQNPQYPKPAPQHPGSAQELSPQYNEQAPQYTAQHYGPSQHDPYYGQ